MSKGFFSGTWPLVRPIGLSPTERINFDEELLQLPIKYSAHDLLDHYALTEKLDPKMILKITEAEEKLIFEMSKVYPRNLNLIKDRFFEFMHEIGGYGLVYAYVTKTDELTRWKLASNIERSIFLCGMRCEDELNYNLVGTQTALELETSIRKKLLETYLEILK
jgi:hypothetical protein